jgi:small subunit ribosomal protein S13
MLHIFGKTIPSDKTFLASLSYLFGINKAQAEKICYKIGLNPSIRVQSLNKHQIRQVINYINKYILIEQDLKKQMTSSKQDLVSIKLCRGLRNLRGLPVRGQRTHTNRKTARKLSKKK